ncbi:hypothetical protein [Geosporobacter ferrireducens]|uniref:hypothetical protein n=1 Tax=Geosporobacter ferrireducens TaxID=1424294 RepID=UPI0012E9E424|nr:hypothetical protein [Geosporobacter ferrireducens]MTI55689.1 IS200/IS605 family element transposase accessory protein TnpB [Geosporobacter ferrireducens]
MDLDKLYNPYAYKKEEVTKVIIGDITNIREDNNLGKVSNQKLHKWAFGKIKMFRFIRQ